MPARPHTASENDTIEISEWVQSGEDEAVNSDISPCDQEEDHHTSSRYSAVANQPDDGFFYWIYALADPRNLEIRYVGYTRCPDRRFRDHIAESDNSGTAQVQGWIAELQRDEVDPLMLKLERCHVETKKQCCISGNADEGDWIKKLLSYGFELLNKSKTRTY